MELFSVDAAIEIGPEILWDSSKVTQHTSSQSIISQPGLGHCYCQYLLPWGVRTLASVSPLNNGTIRPRSSATLETEGIWVEGIYPLVLLGLGHQPRRFYPRPGSSAASEPEPGTRSGTCSLSLPGQSTDLFWNLGPRGGSEEPVTQRTNMALWILFVFIKQAQHVPHRKVRKKYIRRREKIDAACALTSLRHKLKLTVWTIFILITSLYIKMHMFLDGFSSRNKTKQNKTKLKEPFSKLLKFYLFWIYPFFF